MRLPIDFLFLILLFVQEAPTPRIGYTVLIKLFVCELCSFFLSLQWNCSFKDCVQRLIMFWLFFLWWGSLIQIYDSPLIYLVCSDSPKKLTIYRTVIWSDSSTNNAPIISQAQKKYITLTTFFLSFNILVWYLYKLSSADGK